MHKILLAFLIIFSPIPILSETNEESDKACLSSVDDPNCLSSDQSQINNQTFKKGQEDQNNIPEKYEFNKLSQYGIIDYASAVFWCRKNIYENHYEYEMQIEKIYTHPADFCRKHFIPSIQSKSKRICVECDLDPNLILANLVDAIKQPRNNYESNIDISEKGNSEETLKVPSYISEKKFLDQTKENNKSLLDQNKLNSKSLLDQNELNRKGSYVTSSIGLSRISDIEVQNINSDIEFDEGLGLDIGIGYDFGQNRLEASWVRGQSDGVSWLGYSIESDSKIDSLLLSYYYDFRDDKKWSPFVGASMGSTNVDIDGVDDTGMTYGLGYGLSYKSSKVTEIFIKGQTMVVPELNFGNISIDNGNYTNFTVGIRYRF